MLVGFHVLQNGKFVKVYKNKIEILDNESVISIVADTSCFNKESELRTHLGEIDPSCFAIVYTDWNNCISFLGVVDLSQSRLTDSKVLNCNIFGIISKLGDSFFSLSGGPKEIIFEYEKNGNLIHQGDNHLCDMTRYPPVYIPQTHSYIATNKENKPILYDCLFRKINVLSLGAKQRDVLDAQVMPGGRILLLTIEFDKTEKLIYSSIKICDRNFNFINSINLEGYQNCSNFIYYESIKLLQNQYVLVTGSAGFGKKNFIQIFQFHSNKLRKIDGKVIDDKFLAFNSEGQLLTCTREGKIALHYFYTESEKLQKIIASTIPVQSLVSIVSDYCGLFRVKSDKEKNNLFDEVEYSKKNACVIL